MLKHNSYFHISRSDLYIFIHTSPQPLGGILWCGVTVRGAVRSAQYYCAVQYIFQRVEERHQRNLGIQFEDIQHRTEERGTDCSWVLCVMGMASVSWFNLINIQVRANCTTACNIQAALQYVELTHVSSSVSFFSVSVSFYKNVHAAWNRFQSHAGPVSFLVGGVCRPKRKMSIGVGVPTDQSDLLRSHSQRCTRETVSDSSFLFD